MYFKVAVSIYERDFESFHDLLHYLSKNGVFVVDDNDEPITARDLSEPSSFKMVCFYKFYMIMFLHFLSIEMLISVISIYSFLHSGFSEINLF